MIQAFLNVSSFRYHICIGEGSAFKKNVKNVGDIASAMPLASPPPKGIPDHRITVVGIFVC